MFLKRLELQGFKSFAAKTAIDFPDGITIIVGPNGSGKSNITDAIRWLLGERESKSLRGAKSDDLIFAGTEGRARSGLAQASIYFDNSSGFFPIEYKEVVITRRIDRSGDSRFMLNQSEVRLKDIIDFFARSKLGARGLNIIGQGESDAFLRANPIERRVLIEEILGLKEYLLKKHSAERELRHTRTNLDRAKVMLEEMRPHLKMLRRQVGRYTERDKLQAELQELENILYGTKIQNINKELSIFDSKLKIVSNEILIKKQELIVLEEKMKSIELSEPSAKKQIEEIRIKRKELFNEKLIVSTTTHSVKPIAVTESKRDPMIIITEIKNIVSEAINNSHIDELYESLSKILMLIEEIEAKKSNNYVPETAPALNPEFIAKIKSLDQALDDLDLIEKKLTLEMSEFNQVFRVAIKAVEVKKDELDALEDESARIAFEKEKIKFKETELGNHLSAMGKSLADFINNKSLPECDFILTERKIYRLRGELGAIGEVDSSIILEARDAEERFSSTSAQIDELEKASSDLKSLIKDLDNKIHSEFYSALSQINKELLDFSKLVFGGGKIALKLEEIVSQETDESSEANVLNIDDNESRQGITIEVVLPKKRIKGLEALSGGERSLLSITILFSLISTSPPPFIVLDEVDAVLDERNARIFGEMLSRFEKKTQFIVVTHNRATMESADTLYGVTMGKDGSSALVSLKLT